MPWWGNKEKSHHQNKCIYLNFLPIFAFFLFALFLNENICNLISNNLPSISYQQKKMLRRMWGEMNKEKSNLFSKRFFYGFFHETLRIRLNYDGFFLWSDHSVVERKYSFNLVLIESITFDLKSGFGKWGGGKRLGEIEEKKSQLLREFKKIVKGKKK